MNTVAVRRDLGAILAHGEPETGMGQGEAADTPTSTQADTARHRPGRNAAPPCRPRRRRTARRASWSPSTSRRSGPTATPAPRRRDRSPARARLAALAAAAGYPGTLLTQIAHATLPAYRPGDTLSDAQIEQLTLAVEVARPSPATTPTAPASSSPATSRQATSGGATRCGPRRCAPPTRAARPRRRRPAPDLTLLTRRRS